MGINEKPRFGVPERFFAVDSLKIRIETDRRFFSRARAWLGSFDPVLWT